MIQATAVFAQSYRQLRSQKMFYFSLVITIMIVAAFACVGISDENLTIFGKNFRKIKTFFKIFGFGDNQSPTAADIYKLLFMKIGVGMWLTWGASILGLISVSGLVPDMMKGREIQMTLSRPISRTKLFLLKYLSGLLFVGLQITIFIVLAFILIKIKTGDFIFELFWGIPLVLLFFSYLYSISVFFGALTKSMLASLLLTILCWMILAGISLTDSALRMFKIGNTLEVAATEMEIAHTQNLKLATYNPLSQKSKKELKIKREEYNDRISSLQDSLKVQKEDLWQTTSWETGIYYIKTIFPKTSETTDMLYKQVVKGFGEVNQDIDSKTNPREMYERGMSVAKKMEIIRKADNLDRTSIFWVLGTSCIFEAFMLAFAIYLFNKKDF